MTDSTLQMTTIEVLTASPPLRIAGATSYAILSISSIILNSFLMIILIKNYKQYKKHAFYIIVWQHIICDLMTQITQLIVAVPITYAGAPVYGHGWQLKGFTTLDSIAYDGTLYFSFLMTLNRFTVFMAPSLNRVLFERPKIYLTIAAFWIFILAFVATMNVGGCPKYFADNGFYYYNGCEEDKIVGIFRWHTSTYLPVVMIFAYLSIYAYLMYARKVHKQAMNANKRKEFTLLIQSFLICGFLEIQSIAFNLFPALPFEDQWTYVINFVQNWISILNNSINPIVLFIFNSEIRNSLKQFFRKDIKFVHSSTQQPSVPIARRLSSINVQVTPVYHVNTF